MGPFLVNVFLYDLVKYLEDKCDVYNYDDDNTSGTSAGRIDSQCFSLQRIGGDMLSWYDLNYTCMKANHEKFQLILFRKDNNSRLILLLGVSLESMKVANLISSENLMSMCLYCVVTAVGR